MNTLEKYHEEVKKYAISQWKGADLSVENANEDPVIDLLLKALSYQAYNIRENKEEYGKNILGSFLKRIVPFHLIKPVPAFFIVETKMIKDSDETTIVDERHPFTFPFEFKKSVHKEKYTFYPLLETKIINAELKNVERQSDRVWNVELHSDKLIENLSGISFYITDTSKPVGIETIELKCGDGSYESLTLIKPSQYNELPFTKWFNNNHLLQNQNYYLFGTYDYWQEIFLTNTTQLFYIGQDTENKQEIIELKITFDSPVDIRHDKLKINCVPVVNVEKREGTLNSQNPVLKLSFDTEKFLNLFYDKEFEESIDEYYKDKENKKNIDSFFIRQHGVEREDIADKFEKDSYYTILKRGITDDENIRLKYLVTSGATANEIKEGEKVKPANDLLDKNNTFLRLNKKSGRNSVQDEAQKENIAKYYFQTKDRLVTPADIKAFIRAFYNEEEGKEKKLDEDIEGIGIVPNHEIGDIVISINLRKDSLLKSKEHSDKRQSLEKILQQRIAFKSTNIMSFSVIIS